MKHPVILNSCLDALQWIRDNCQEKISSHADTDCLYIAGDSAGGNLTATTVFESLKTGKHSDAIKGQIIIYGCLADYETRLNSASGKTYRDYGYIINQHVIDYCMISYFGAEAYYSKQAEHVNDLRINP